MKRAFIAWGLLTVLSEYLFFSVAIAAEFRYDSHAKRDPFLVASKSGLSGEKGVGSLASVKLEGVMVDSIGNSIAVINGETVLEGGKLGGIVVQKITSQGVVLAFEGKNVFMPVVEEINEVRTKESRQ